MQCACSILHHEVRRHALLGRVVSTAAAGQPPPTSGGTQVISSGTVGAGPDLLADEFLAGYLDACARVVVKIVADKKRRSRRLRAGVVLRVRKGYGREVKEALELRLELKKVE